MGFLRQNIKSKMDIIFNCGSSSSTIYQINLLVSPMLKFIFKRITNQSEHSLKLTIQSGNNQRAVFYQLYQLTSAVQLKLSNFNSLSLSTPFNFRFHDLTK